MAVARRLFPAVVGAFLFAAPLAAQATGSVSGTVRDSASGQPLGSVSIAVEGTLRRTMSNMDGSYTISDVPAGSQRLTARRIGYGSQNATVTVAAGSTARQDFSMTAQAAALGEIVVTGYGTQRREAISGSVSTINADAANVGLITNASQMLQGRVGGVQMIANNGEPGAGVQIRVRGGTSISASNEPLYVVDGVPLQNESADPGRPEIAGVNPGLARNPLNSINPNDIESITVLKDASATAIYGSRGANGVVLIQTKRVAGGTGQMEYESYVGMSSRTKSLGLATGDQYRAYVQAQVASGGLPATADDPVNLGTANTDWEKEISKTGLTSNHNLAFSGGSSSTQYRASINYFKQQGVVIANDLERYQGRLNAIHDAFNGKLRLGVNMMAARVNNDFAPVENTGGFLGGLFTNMAIYNPTFPVKRTNGQYYEKACPLDETQTCNVTAVGEKNPVALAELWEDVAPEDRVLGNITGTYSLLPNLSTQTTLGTDRTSSVRQTFAPRTSPAGAQTNGLARQASRNLQNVNFQQLVTYTPTFGQDKELEVVGGYEYTKIDNRGFEAIMQGFITDAFGVNNLGAGTQSASPVPTSYRVESQLVSFFSRANYSMNDKYFLTGVIRYDGSSRLAPGHRYATFPAVSGSWRISEEDFMAGNIFSTLSIRAGWGKQGNQAVAPYQTKLLLRADPGAIYPIGNVLTTGLRAAQVGNPDLTWETATQVNVGFDYGFMNERFTGVIDFYQKTTKDLLLEVDVPQPAVVNTRLENIGSLRNRGVEITFNTPLVKQMNRTLNLELVATAERNEVTSIGERTFINTGFVSGQGQSGQYSQRIMVGEAIGTFFAPHFLRVGTGAAAGRQIFSCKTASTSCVNGETTNPTDDDRIVVGNANPDFTLGVSNNATWKSFDASWLWRGEFGGKVFNNTNLVYQTKSNASQGRNFLAAALTDADDLTEPAKYSDRWIEDRTFVRLQNLTIGYQLPARLVRGRATRVFLSGDNLLLLSGYSGYDPEVFVASGLASRGIDYLTYPRARTFTLGARFQF
ncbi:MAG: SusC/RagA family TonB-linked outer membrane protein [Gemmatimonadaceae bacterium]